MSADVLVPYRNRVVVAADGVAESFPSDEGVQLYMAGMKAGADAVLAMAELGCTELFTELFAFMEYQRDYGEVGRR